VHYHDNNLDIGALTFQDPSVTKAVWVVQKMALEFKSGCKLSRKVFPSAVARN
jgi:hypothetical protein